jgi:hypothetical protein
MNKDSWYHRLYLTIQGISFVWLLIPLFGYLLAGENFFSLKDMDQLLFIALFFVGPFFLILGFYIILMWIIFGSSNSRPNR